MTVTLTTGELNDFQVNLSKYYAKRFKFAIEHISFNEYDIMRLDPSQRLKELLDKYDKENPMPDWRSLL